MQGFEPMLDHKYSTIASGAILVESADRAPDGKLLQLQKYKGVNFRWQTPKTWTRHLLPSRGSIMHIQLYQEPDNFGYSNSKTRHSKLNSQTASAAVKCPDPMIAKVMKVRPRDPSCVA
jgi:hypothetical protein